MSESMPYGEMVQELTFLRSQYEQFIIDRERERIIKLLEKCLDHDYNVPSKDGWSGKMHHLDVFCTLCRAVALIKGESK